MIWKEETITRLRTLWAEGHSTSEIGRRLGASKNAIVGKAHRLDLDGRPSPIRRGGPAPVIRAPSPPPAPRITLPPMPPVEAYVPRAAPAKPLPVGPVPAAEVVEFRPPSPRQCTWLSGDRPRDFVRCEHDSVLGKSFCPTHYAVCYTKRREQAA